MIVQVCEDRTGVCCDCTGVLYVLKKLFTVHDRNLLHSPELTGSKTVSWARPLSMSAVLRVKDVTRSTLNDLLLAVVTSCLRRYLVRSGVRHPKDLTATLLVDLQPATHDHPFRRDTSSTESNGLDGPYSTTAAQRLSTVAAPPECDPAGRSPVWITTTSADGVCVNGIQTNGGGGGTTAVTLGPVTRHRRQRDFSVDVRLSLVNVVLPTNTEGTIPQLWDVKQRMNEVAYCYDNLITVDISVIALLLLLLLLLLFICPW